MGKSGRSVPMLEALSSLSTLPRGTAFPPFGKCSTTKLFEACLAFFWLALRGSLVSATLNGKKAFPHGEKLDSSSDAFSKDFFDSKRMQAFWLGWFKVVRL